MGRSRSRRRCETSSSSSSSDSEDSEDERQREEERRAAKAARRAQRKAEQELREAESAALRIMAGIPYAITDGINSYEEDAQDEEDDIMEDTVELRARKPASAPAEVVDMSDWAKAEQYLREHFEVHASVKKVALLVQYFEPDDNSRPKLCALSLLSTRTSHLHTRPPAFASTSAHTLQICSSLSICLCSAAHPGRAACTTPQRTPTGRGSCSPST